MLIPLPAPSVVRSCDVADDDEVAEVVAMLSRTANFEGV
jgi:hypothetical protein